MPQLVNCLLADISGRYPPTQWARLAINAYTTHGADRIVAEVNNGGDMVEATLRMVDPNVAFTAVHASRGKVVRAEPVAALYEQGRAHHIGTFPATGRPDDKFYIGYRPGSSGVFAGPC